jgi:MFS family permease
MQPKPGIIPLRPLALGEIFDGGFQAIRSNPRTMIGLSAVVLAIVTAVTTVPQAFLLQGTGAVLSDAASPPTVEESLNQLSSTLSAGGISSLVTVIAVEIITAMLVLTVSSAVLGQRIGPGQAWARVRGRVFAVLGLALIQVLVVVGSLLIPILPGVVIGLSGSPAAGFGLGLLGFLVGVVLAIFLATRLTFSAPALLLEEQKVFAALGRSSSLVRGSFWRVFGITLLAQLVVGIGSLVIQTPFSAVSVVIQLASGGSQPYQDFWANLGQLAVQGVGQVIAGAIFYPFTAAVTTLLYIDVRIRREGLDVELLRVAEAGRGTPA